MEKLQIILMHGVHYEVEVLLNIKNFALQNWNQMENKMTWFDVVYNDANSIVDLEVTETTLVVALADMRVIHLPMSWFPFLETATPQQRQASTVSEWSVDWETLDDGFSLETVLLGQPPHRRNNKTQPISQAMNQIE